MPACKWLLSFCLMLPAAVAAGDIDHEEARRLFEAGEILPLTAILEAARTAQPGRVIEVELEREHGRMVYELEVLDPRGQVWELRLDAASGALLERERED